MNITVKDTVLVPDFNGSVAGTKGVVVSTHTYKESGIQVASVKSEGVTVWVDVTKLKKVS